MCVSLSIAKFLKYYLGYNKETLYVYSNGIKRFSLEPDLFDPIPAPEINDAIEFLWINEIKIYYLPEEGKCRGVINLLNDSYKLKDLYNTPMDTYSHCLDFISSFFK